MMSRLLAAGLGLVCSGASAQPTFRVTIDPSRTHGAPEGPVSGRLIVYLVDEASSIRNVPSAAPFFDDPQPMIGVDVEAAPLGSIVEIPWGASGTATFPVGDLPPGAYRAQAVLDRFRLSSDWTRERGNLFGGTVRFEHRAGGSPVVDLSLSGVMMFPHDKVLRGVELVAVESHLLGDARLERAHIEIGVVPPIGAEPGRRYPVVYEVPGFGGSHYTALDRRDRLAEAEPASALGRLARSVYWVVLNPDGPNGHHKFVDSRANGPVGRALVEEVIPAVDRFFPTIPSAEARLLRGHSSGGWSVIHLALTYPETFGGAWSSAPDPLDFRAFQAVNIYDDANMYTDSEGNPWPSYTDASGVVRMTIADENAMESVMGPGNTSGQQWDSWQAAFGTVDELGNPAPLYDEQTGAIDKQMAERFRRNDLAERVRQDRAKVGRLARDRVRVIVGDADEYDLDEGVRLFVESVEGFGFGPQEDGGWYAIVPGATHGSVLRSQAGDELLADMVDEAETRLEAGNRGE